MEESRCSGGRLRDAVTIVILGATGDLVSRKLMPALYALYCEGSLPENFRIIGCGRTHLDRDEFRAIVEAGMKAFGKVAGPLHGFIRHLHYKMVDYGDPGSFERLAASILRLDKEKNSPGNKLFYLALPPSLYKTAVKMLGKAGLHREGQRGFPWSRLVIEKPFGRDLKTAVELNTSIKSYFKEHQLFRIDHYLAKETVQNVLMFRFANSVFEPIWNRGYIDHVDIIAAEDLGVEHRAGYYEQAGVVRDMFQNHMMQLLALIAMEAPSRFETDRVWDERVKVFRSLRPFKRDQLTRSIMLGQYGRGLIRGRKVPAYREEPGVAPHSLTPTFARMRLFIDNWRWQGVPFYLTSGKRMRRKLTEITVHFKGIPHSIFRQTMADAVDANRLTLGIYPDEKVTLDFQTKRPGTAVCLRRAAMEYNFNRENISPVPDAYGKVLTDCMLGDQMLFWRQDALEDCWAYLTPLVEECETCGNPEKLLRFYEAGTWGPEYEF